MSHGDKDHIQKVAERIGNIESGHNRKTSSGVNLGQRRHSASPEKLIDKNRPALPENRQKYSPRNAYLLIYILQEGELLFPEVRRCHKKDHFHKTGDHCCKSGTLHSHPRRAQLSEDQDIIKEDIRYDRKNPGNHGQYALTNLSELRGIDLRYGKGKQSGQHDIQIVHGLSDGPVPVNVRAFSLQIEEDQVAAEQGKGCDSQDHTENTDPPLQPEYIPDVFHIPAAVILGTENPRAG